MKQQIRSQRFLQRRKFLMILPLLVLPFVTLIFWVLGGGKTKNSQSVETQKALNMDLPDAFLNKDKSLDKMSYYHLAKMDSNRRKKQIKNDPYYQDDSSSAIATSNEQITLLSTGENKTSIAGYNGRYSDPNVAKVYQRLDQLDSILNKPVTSPKEFTDVSAETNGQKNVGISSEDIDRLEQMMQMMNQPDGNDPEMEQLNNMLEKIIDIQHPQRVAEKLKTKSMAERGRVFTVFPEKDRIPVSLFGGNRNPSMGITYDSNRKELKKQNGFYSLAKQSAADNQPNAIRAVVHETQTLVNGSTVKLRLTDDVYINGVLIPKGHFIFGRTSLDGERLHIQIKNIRYGRSLFPVALSVYDLDGLKGIHVPGAITRKVAKQSAGRAMQGLGLATLNPTLKAQAASAGIEAAKNLISKKVKLVKVTVKAGYHVLLKNEKQ